MKNLLPDVLLYEPIRRSKLFLAFFIYMFLYTIRTWSSIWIWTSAIGSGSHSWLLLVTPIPMIDGNQSESKSD